MNSYYVRLGAEILSCLGKLRHKSDSVGFPNLPIQCGISSLCLVVSTSENENLAVVTCSPI